MVMPTIATEVAKVAIAKLAEVKPDDIARAARAIGKAAGTGSMLVPGLGVFGAGLLIGTGIGFLTAPRSGRETRERLISRLQRQLGRFRKQRAELEPVPANGEPTHAGS